MTSIQPETLQFLRNLSENNNREWFNEHKPEYLNAHENMVRFMDDLITEMKKIDHIENESGKKSLFRIYRDVRFSKDKSPYKNHFAGRMARATQWLRGGYFIRIEPDNSFLAAGFFNPNSGDLKRIRTELEHDAEPLRAILQDPAFRDMFGGLKGKAVATAPRGFDKNHPNIDLIRYKQYLVTRPFSDEEVLDEDFIFEVVKSFIAVRPFFDYMSEVLTRHLE